MYFELHTPHSQTITINDNIIYMNILRRYYHKIRFTIQSLMYPKTLFVGDTTNKILTHNWPTAMSILNGSTIIRDKKMFYEPNEYKLYKQMMVGKKVFFDIGAHIGWYCLVANGLGVESSYAFEIVEYFAKIIKRNFKLNGVGGEVFRVALGIPGTKVDFKQSFFSGNNTAISLDDFCETHNVWPDVIKIDIEGAELDALRAMSKVLARHPAIHISIHSGFLKKRNQDDKEVLELLHAYGYRVVYSNEDTYFLE